MSGKASPCSRMPGDMAVRTSVASISMRALRSAFSMMSSVTGSTATELKGVLLAWMICAGMCLSVPDLKVLAKIDQDVADMVDAAGAAGFDQRGGVHLHDNGGPGDHVASTQLGAVIDHGRDHGAIGPQFVVAHLGGDRIAVAHLERRGGPIERGAHGDGAQVHPFV